MMRDPLQILWLGMVSLALAVPGCAADPAGRPPAAEKEALAMSEREEVRLGSAPVRVRVPLQSQAIERLRTTEAGSGRIWLVIEELKLERPGGYYQVYLGLPDQAEPDPGGPHFVGNLSLYGAPRGEPGEQSFDVTRQIREWRDTGPGKAELQVTFVPGNREAGAAEPARSFMTLRRLRLIER